VGPTARGVFDARATTALDSISYWMKYNSKSIYGCTYAPDEYKEPDHTALTYNPATRRLYIHLLQYPGGSLTLPGYRGKVKYVQFLHDASEIRLKSDGSVTATANDLVLSLPVIKPPMKIPVIELILK
jgi:alpha-L-fucosidase